MMLAAAAALVIVSSAPLSISALMGWDATLPGLEAAKSFMAMMGDRSPGDRTVAELTKSKSVAAADEPQQRALGKVHDLPPPDFEHAIALPPPELTDMPMFATALNDLGPLTHSIMTPPPGGGGIITTEVPPGGGGTPITPPGQNNPPPPPPPPAVPEPGTWATMLLGFGLTGWQMRRRKRTVAVPLRT